MIQTQSTARILGRQNSHRNELLDRLVSHIKSFSAAGARVDCIRLEPWVFRTIYGGLPADGDPVLFGIDVVRDSDVIAYDFEVTPAHE
ncbi:hypothetical protein [Natronobacterium gregoryi]|uniref:Uncharacterized protein n=2 Tax=Natronobacterium gregoryi TaxID=44930 RepID=L0AM61_NATGS|nr:hypothetical protein [Natronobacterium gregoryi]AFZ74549.1 hypothetical protein Natgr_3430 [Natronobacterium gregoryi SP2]ELY72380.1 hypothetical protein C490_03513 [Natronobacterium gregoryi SP2]PLK21708.1 hypothetical protein CYV19_02405 [Natronobacterium gregoryi SP2]SFI96459.1 hypothetical protein SAMN05443661_110156 [Natronobacterium gregoryi]